MLFQTPEFLILFIVAIAMIAISRRNTRQHALITVLSYVFYAWLDVRFLILLLITSLVDFVAALGMDKEELSWKRRWKLSGFTMVMALLTLGLNWQLVQGVGREGIAWTIDSVLQPLLVGDWTLRATDSIATPRTYAAWISLGACLIFSIAWPFVYEWLWRAYRGEARRKAFLVASVISNLGVLGFFKYFNFFIAGISAASVAFGADFTRPHLDVLLPMGISFYTFVSMSYTIDAYRKQLTPERSFMRFSLFVCYFPHLVAGPIIRPDNFFPTLGDPWRFSSARVISGFNLCLNGLVKKVLIADSISPLVDQLLANPASSGASSLVVMLGAFLFAVQIYCDFSGYSDIARGVSRMFGPELPINFNFPYFSTSIIDFWRTWHISLSTWLRDYLYIPLGGGRGSVPRVYSNLLATMVLGGLWHGASANFVLWGFYQGILLCLNRYLRWILAGFPLLEKLLHTRIGTAMRWIATMYLVVLGWLLFRINNPIDPFDFADLTYCIKKFVLIDGNLNLQALGLGPKAPFLVAMLVCAFLLLHALSYFTGRLHERMDGMRVGVLAG
ncbi:MAG: MBOAT family protein, partial [Planctomycetota bacterium]